MQAYVNYFRRFSILARLLTGFATALVPMMCGLTWIGDRLSTLRSGLLVRDADGAAGMAVQLNGIQADMWLALAASVMVGIVLIIGVTISIVQPMNLLKATVKGIAAGDLSQALDTRWSDEVGQMTAALATMRQALADVVLNIHRSAQAVSAASRDLSQGNADLSQRTETSAARLQETASSMEQIQAMARMSAESAQRVSEVAREAGRTAEKAGQSLCESAATMGALTASSHKMADIVGVIDAIAFQTNILALNAAVEAARAGEQGRGFAVVASEVRALASRSAASAKEIKSLIQTAISQAQTGAKSVESAGAEMTLVMASVNTVTGHVAEIKNAADEQCSGIASVSRSVSELDSVTQRNSALVEEASSGADKLQNEARRLIQSVSVFRLPAFAGTG